jgi:hypothetical protein
VLAFRDNYAEEGGMCGPDVLDLLPYDHSERTKEQLKKVKEKLEQRKKSIERALAEIEKRIK